MSRTESAGDSWSMGVVIVTYNSAADITAAVEPLLDRSTSVVVVDNDSRDDTVGVVRSQFGDSVTLLANPDNRGFARAVNQGLEKLAGSGVEFVLLLNPDCVISTSSVAKLLRALREDPSLGAVAPVVTYRSDTIKVMSAGREPTASAMLFHYSGLSRLFPHSPKLRGRHLYHDFHSGEDQDVEWVSGACVLIRGSAIAAVGVLTERWFMYGEDIEYCHRLRASGYRVMVVADAGAEHVVGGSQGLRPPVARRPRPKQYWAVNTYDYYVMTYSPGIARRGIWRLAFGFGMVTRSLKYAAVGAIDRSRRADSWSRSVRFLQAAFCRMES